MNADPRRSRLRRLVAGCATLFVLLVVGGLAVVELDRAQQDLGDSQLLLAEAGTIRAHVEDELYGTLSLARGLPAYVTAHPDLGEPERLEVLLETLLADGEHVHNIGLAPDDVIEVVFPLEGNEAAVGLRYVDVPEQYAAVRQARTTRMTVLAGPVELVQGGRALINYAPVFVDGEHWGTISLVIDVDSVLAAVRADISPSLPIEWGVRTWTNYGESQLLAGDLSLFDAPGVRLTFDVPDGTWEIAATTGGPTGVATRTLVLRGAAVALAFVVTALVFEAVRERWRALELSLHDPLTGLPNRRLLEERIDRAVAWAHRDGTGFVVAFVDVDRFKQVNDTFGHRAGDHVLREVAARLEARTRGTDTVARVGGDEFVVVLLDAHPDRSDALAAELERAVGAPVMWDGQELVVGASVGVAVHPRDGHDASTLLQAADGAMYEVKQHHRGRVLP